MNFTLYIYKKWLTFMNCGCYILRFKNCCGNSIRNKSSHISIMRFLLYFYYRFCFCALLKKRKVVKIENHLSLLFQITLNFKFAWSFSEHSVLFICITKQMWVEQIVDGQWFWFASQIKYRYLSSLLIPPSNASNDATSRQNWIESKPLLIFPWNSWCFLVMFRSKLWSHCQ